MTAALEEIKIVDHSEWKTLNTAAPSTKLPAGETPNAQNVWVDENPGAVISANGYVLSGTAPSGNPITFLMNYFKTTSGTQTLIVSDNAKVWTTVDLQTFTEIITGLSSSFQLRGAVIRDKLWLTNGNDSVRTFDGTTVVVLDGTGVTPNVPKGRYISYHDERVWLYHIPSARSQCAFSALTNTSGTIIAPDNASAWPSSNTLQISEGDADFGTGLVLYRGYLHFFKQYSIWRLVGYDEYNYTRVKTRASTGTRFNESIQIVDSFVHFIGIDGIYVFDGEETSRISDIIGSLFGNIQQPILNTSFWEVQSSSDWNAGTVPANATVNNQIVIKPADDTQANFNAGAVKTNVDADTNPGYLQLALAGNVYGALITGCTGQLIVPPFPSWYTIGQNSYITDGNNSHQVGFTGGGAGQVALAWMSTLPSQTLINKVIVRQLLGTPSTAPGDGSYISDSYILANEGTVGSPNWVRVANLGVSGSASIGPTDLTLTFSSVLATQVQVVLIADDYALTITELETYRTGYASSGKFVSRTLDYGIAPTSFGKLVATSSLNGGTLQFFTQSSADGASWDSEVNLTSGTNVGSTVRRYLRWGAYFTVGSSGAATPQINNVYLGMQYLSAVHNTGGSIYSWGPFQADYNQQGQVVNFYYRAATTSGGVPGASWSLIVPGAVIDTNVTYQYIQFKVEILSASLTQLPYVNSVTINWVLGSGDQVQTLQNVASFFWKNRYWLAGAKVGSASNNTMLIRGKKTFGSPWQQKDWNILSFVRFQDSLFGGSSADSSIYKLDTGYSKNGSAMDCTFETGDFTFGGFFIQLVEVLVEVERTGPYSLSLGVSTDRGLNYTEKLVDLTQSSYANNYTMRLNFNVTTDRFRLRVRINAADEPFQVNSIKAYYKMSAARGSIK